MVPAKGEGKGARELYDGGYNKQATKYNGEATTTVAARGWLAGYLQPDQGGGDGGLSSGPTVAALAGDPKCGWVDEEGSNETIDMGRNGDVYV